MIFKPGAKSRRGLPERTGREQLHILGDKLEKDMLKIDARNAPGRSVDPRSVSVFIDVLSRLLAFAKKLCWTAISMASRDSL